MSSYLTFYLVPKKEKLENQEPLTLISFSRSSNIYQAFQENASVAFIGNGDKPNYTEITKDLITSLEKSLQEDFDKAKSRNEAKLKALKELPELKGEALEEYLYESTEMSEYIEELKNTLNHVDFISSIICDIDLGYTDFEKVLANID